MNQLHEDILFSKKRLDKISSFAFENFMQTIKKYVRSSSNPIIQWAEWQSEFGSIGVNEGPAVSLKFKDSLYWKYVLLKLEVVATCYACKRTKDIYFEDLFKKPVNSNVFSTVYIRILQEQVFDYIEIDGSNLATKVCALP